MQNSRKAILWGLEDVFGWAVEFFLGAKNGWEVIRISEREGIDSLIQAIKAASPEAIFFCKSDCFLAFL